MFRRVLGGALFITVCMLRFLHIFSEDPSGHLPRYTIGQSQSTSRAQATSKYAFVFFETDYTKELAPDEEDHYYIGTRVLIHQLLHNPKTRTNTSIPVVILATENVKPHRIQQLRRDGADVRIVEKIPTAPWANGEHGYDRYEDVLSKLRVFELVEYEKILLMDSDMLILDRLDGIFEDPTTAILPTRPESAVEDEGALPSQYIIAAQRAFTHRKHSYPPEIYDSIEMSSGFVVLQPSRELFSHYMKLLQIPHRVGVTSPDQDLLQYAHRRNGPMPWADIEYHYTTSFPSMREYQKGAKTLHEKWWDPIEGDILHDMDPYLKELWEKAKFEMDVRTAMENLQQR